MNSANVGRILSQSGDGRTFHSAVKFLLCLLGFPSGQHFAARS